MNLSLFDKLKDSTKDDEKDQSFMEGLSQFWQDKFGSEKEEKMPRQEISMIQELESNGKITVEYRDKMLLERSKILNECAKDTLEKGQMYFVYSRSSSKEKSFNLCVCEEQMSGKIISVSEDDLPEGVGVDDVLRLLDGKYVFDEETTGIVEERLTLMTKLLLEEQNLMLSEKRKDGAEYEVIEVSGNSAWIMNITQNDGDCFEEIAINKKLLDSLNPGDVILFTSEEYIKV